MREYYSLHKFSLEIHDETIAHLYLQECRIFDREYHYLEDVWTHPGHRGNGYAGSLIDRAIAYVTSDPFSSGLIATTRYGRKIGDTSHDLIEFYKSIGFEVVGSESRYDRGEDGEYIQRDLLSGHTAYGALLAHTGAGMLEARPKISRYDQILHRVYPIDPHLSDDSIIIDTRHLGGSSRYIITDDPYRSDIAQSLARAYDVGKYIVLSLGS